MNFRKKTSPLGNSSIFSESKGITRYCASCKQWKSVGGSKKHPIHGYMECKECVQTRLNKQSVQK